MDIGQWLAVHCPYDHGLGIHRLRYTHAARQSRFAGIAGQMQVGSIVRGVDTGRLDTRRLQDIAEPYAGPLSAACAAIRPLISTGWRREERPSVAAAFEHHAPRLRLEFRLELAKRKFEFVVDLAFDRELPLVRLFRFVGNLSVIADVEFLDGRRVIVEKDARASPPPAGARRSRPACRSCRDS